VPTSLRKCSPAPSPPRSSLAHCIYTVLRIPNIQYDNQVGDSTRDQAQRSYTFQLFLSACTHANHGRVFIFAYEFLLKNA
jgi:hypothetical protein